MNDAFYRSGFEFDKRLDSSLYKIYEQRESYAVVVFENYVTSIHLKLAELEEAVLDRNTERIDLLAHAHISTYNYVGLSHLAEMMREMRHRAKLDDWSRVHHLTEQVRIQTESISPIINEELKRLQLYVKSDQL